MQDAAEIPQSFVISAVLGTFVMETHEDGYRGSANGYVCDVRFRFAHHGLSASVSVSSPRGKVEFEAVSFDLYDMCQHISEWMDSVYAEEIEDFASDVQYLDTSGGKLAYWSYDTHLHTTPIVFVHGGPGGDSNPVKARRLRTGHPVYLFDQMGCGMSDPVRDFDSWTVSEYVTQMREFIDSIPSKEVIIYGASWGAGLTVAYAGETGLHKVKALVLCSPFLSSKLWSEDAL